MCGGSSSSTVRWIIVIHRAVDHRHPPSSTVPHRRCLTVIPHQWRCLTVISHQFSWQEGRLPVPESTCVNNYECQGEVIETSFSKCLVLGVGEYAVVWQDLEDPG
eukprot:827381-Pelagomonas_calceolata.AAC.1